MSFYKKETEKKIELVARPDENQDEGARVSQDAQRSLQVSYASLTALSELNRFC